MTADGFDIDEFPIQFETYYERVIAWRLKGGGSSLSRTLKK